MDRDWTDLLPELLQLMSKKLTSISDFIRLRAVCTRWKELLSDPPRHLPPQFPWLILPRGPDNGEDANLGSSLSMYDLSQSRTHILDLPAIQGKRICGSSHGWVILEKEREVWLLNPITRDEINLPSLSVQPNTFEENTMGGVIHCDLRFCIKKAILSANPRMDNGCVVMALFSGSWEAAFCRIGDERWTTVIADEEIAPPWRAIGICYQSGLFYAILGNGHACIFDIDNGKNNYIPSTVTVEPNQEVDCICTVEGGNEHGMKVFCWDFPDISRFDPLLYMDSFLMLSTQKKKWLHVTREQSEDSIFFLGGFFHCIALPADNLQLNGSEGNCIYYICPEFERIIGNVSWVSCSIKRFRRDDRSVTTLASHLGFFDQNNYCRYEIGPCFLWLTPTLC